LYDWQRERRGLLIGCPQLRHRPPTSYRRKRIGSELRFAHRKDEQIVGGFTHSAGAFTIRIRRKRRSMTLERQQ
jgi:hypothetical protein